MNTDSTINPQLNNVFTDMQQLVEDRAAGIRQTESIYALDEHNVHSISHAVPIIIEGHKVSSVKHALVLLKAIFARDEKALKAIGSAYSYQAAADIHINNFKANHWKAVESRCIQLAISLKYKQHPKLAENLKFTGVKKIVYTGSDTYLTCGLNIKSDNIFYPQFWSGANVLGKALEYQRKLL